MWEFPTVSLKSDLWLHRCLEAIVLTAAVIPSFILVNHKFSEFLNVDVSVMLSDNFLVVSQVEAPPLVSFKSSGSPSKEDLEGRLKLSLTYIAFSEDGVVLK